MSLALNGTNGVTYNDGTQQSSAPVGKNLIINGDMRIDQRNAGASITPTVGTYTLDRFTVILAQASKFSLQQNAGAVTPPVGFTNYLGVTSLSAYSVLTNDTFLIAQRIEGYNIADLAWGTADAKTVTISFWVRSSLTGTFGGALRNSNSTRSYPFTYTINTANTWEKKTITIAGDTTGTWLTTNGVGVNLFFGLGAGTTYSGTAGAWASANYQTATGATSVVGTSGATFYITGVQLEVGDTATDFENLQYGTQLQLCQRYYEETLNSVSFVKINGYGTHNGQKVLNTEFKATKRANPTVVIYDSAGTPASNKLSIYNAAGTRTDGQTVALVQTDLQQIKVYPNNGTYSGIGFYYTASAEL